MATMDVTTELRLTELRKRNLRKNFDHIEEHFDSITKSISQRNNELTSLEESINKRIDEIQSREQGVESVQESVNQRFKELELREKSFEKKERLVFEEQSKKLNLLRVSVEKQSREVQNVRRVFEEDLEALQVKEKRFVLLQKSIEKRSKEVEVVQNSIKGSFRDLKFKERQLCLMEKSVEDRVKDNDLKERLIETCSKELELNEKRLEERAKEVELKEEKFEEHEKAFALKEKRLEEHEKAFSLKEKRLEERADGIELKGKRFEEHAKKVELKEKRFEGRLKAFDWKEKRLEERSVEIEQKGERIEKRAKEVELKKKRFEEHEKAFALKEKRLKERAVEIELKGERIEERAKEVELKEKRLEERSVEIELKGERIEERAKEVELKEKRFEEHEKAFSLKDKRLEERAVEIELKGERIEERAKEVELKEKRFEEHEKAFALKEKRLEERSVEIELKGERIEERAEEVELKEKRFEERLKAFDLKEKRLEECDIEIELKAKRLEEHSREIELKEKKLEERSREIDLKANGLEERYREVELKGKESEQCSLDIEAKDQGFTENVVGDNAIEVYAPKHARLCVIMDGNSLQKFLNKHWEEHDLMHDEVLYALREASEPAKIVLDAMQGFYPLNADNGNTSIELSVVRKSCILLLEQLIRVSPEITPIVKGEAMKLAFDWMTKMSPKAENHMECLGFLLLLAAYGLASAFDEDELVSQLVVVARDTQAPELCQLLGLTPDKISDFIHSLIARKQHLDAIRLVYAFDLVGAFEPVRLLKHYLKVSKQAARKICRMQNDSPASQIEALNKRVADAKAVIQCIEDHNLESELPPKNLECSITELEKKKANIIKTFPSSVPKPQPRQHCKKTCIIVAPHVPLLTTAPTTDPTPNMQEEQESGNKRLRTALSATDALHASLGATSTIYSMPFPNLKSSGIHTDQGRGGPVTRSNTEKKCSVSTSETPIPAAQPLQQSGRKRRRAIAAHPNLHSKFGVQDSTGHYFSAGFPSITRRTGPYPFSYYPEPGYYHGEPAAPCGGPCDALNGPCGYRGPSYWDEQAHYGSNGLPPRCHSSLYP